MSGPAILWGLIYLTTLFLIGWVGYHWIEAMTR